MLTSIQHLDIRYGLGKASDSPYEQELAMILKISHFLQIKTFTYIFSAKGSELLERD